MLDPLIEEYSENGFVLLRNLIPINKIDELQKKSINFINSITGKDFSTLYDPALLKFFNENKKKESDFYDKFPEQEFLKEFSCQEELLAPIRNIMKEEFGVYKKILLRIDLPKWIEPLSFWHQDYFYLKGSTKVIIAWIPLQDTTFLNGCLSVMPKSHLLGPLEHDGTIETRKFPRSIFNNEIRMIEVKKGDCILLSTLLLHSSNLNLSNNIRYTVQSRYTPINIDKDELWSEIIPLPT